MRDLTRQLGVFIVLAAASIVVDASPAEQAAVQPVINAGERTLTFDWPAIRIGTGEYAEGPTGVTVFHFPKRVLAAVDVRGGSPGTVNTDILRLGYEAADIDGASALPKLASFAAFQSGIRERCAEPPLARNVAIVGNYRMLGEP